jgi:acyl-CoA reductase-like NAD-dependent aldehyde dehydrogenase
MTSNAQLEAKIAKAQGWFVKNRFSGQEGMEERFEKLTNVHTLLGERLNEFAKLMTLEMGKPLA